MSLPPTNRWNQLTSAAQAYSLEIVGRIEQVLAACLSLPACEGSKAVQPASDRARKAKLAFAVCRNRPEQRGAGLVRPMGTAKTLDRAIGAPAWLEQEMHPLLLVHDVLGRVIGSPGPPGIREDEHPFTALHESRGLGLAGPRRSGLKLLAAAGRRNQTLGAPRHFGDAVVTEMLEEAVQRGHDRRECAELLDELVARGLGLGIVDRVAIFVLHRDRPRGAGIIGEDAHLPGGERPLEIIYDIFARRQINLQVRPLVGAERA